MAVSSYNHYYLFLFTLVLSLSLSSADQLENDICSSTKNQTFCHQFLNYFYKQGTSLKDLTSDAIQATKRYLYFTNDEIHVREVSALLRNNPVLSEQYRKCGVQYNDTQTALTRSLISLVSGDVKALPPLASFALKQVQNCDLNFVPIGSEPPEFKSLNEQSIVACGVVLDVTSRLAAAGGV